MSKKIRQPSLVHGTKVLGLKKRDEILSPLEAVRNFRNVSTGHSAWCSLEEFLKALIKIGPRRKEDNSFLVKNWGIGKDTYPIIVFVKHYEPLPSKQGMGFDNNSVCQTL